MCVHTLWTSKQALEGNFRWQSTHSVSVMCALLSPDLVSKESGLAAESSANFSDENGW